MRGSVITKNSRCSPVFQSRTSTGVRRLLNRPPDPEPPASLSRRALTLVRPTPVSACKRPLTVGPIGTSYTTANVGRDVSGNATARTTMPSSMPRTPANPPHLIQPGRDVGAAACLQAPALMAPGSTAAAGEPEPALQTRVAGTSATDNPGNSWSALSCRLEMIAA